MKNITRKKIHTAIKRIGEPKFYFFNSTETSKFVVELKRTGRKYSSIYFGTFLTRDDGVLEINLENHVWGDGFQALETIKLYC